MKILELRTPREHSEEVSLMSQEIISPELLNNTPKIHSNLENSAREF